MIIRIISERFYPSEFRTAKIVFEKAWQTDIRTYGRTYGQTDPLINRDARTHLKSRKTMIHVIHVNDRRAERKDRRTDRCTDGQTPSENASNKGLYWKCWIMQLCNVLRRRKTRNYTSVTMKTTIKKNNKKLDNPLFSQRLPRGANAFWPSRTMISSQTPMKTVQLFDTWMKRLRGVDNATAWRKWRYARGAVTWRTRGGITSYVRRPKTDAAVGFLAQVWASPSSIVSQRLELWSSTMSFKRPEIGWRRWGVRRMGVSVRMYIGRVW